MTRGFERLDVDLVRTLAYLQRNDPRINSRVVKYLRCEALNAFDRRHLPELEPRLQEYHPQEMVERLGQLMAVVGEMRLVLLVDQLEEMANFDDDPQLADTRFRRAMQSLCAIIGAVPGSIGVIACLEDFYETLAKKLTKTVRDRIEQNPAPMRLDANRTGPEIAKIVTRRLDELYKAASVRNDDPLFPFPRSFLDQLTGMRTRDVLEQCRKFRDGRTDERHTDERNDDPQSSEDPAADSLTSLWNDSRTACQLAVPDAEEQQAELLAWAIENCGAEMVPALEFTVDRDGREAVVPGRLGAPGKKQRIAVCNRGTQGGGLTKQLQGFLSHVGDYLPVVVRSAEFPTNPRTQVAKLLGDLVASGGLHVAFDDSHWRQILAFQEFYRRHQHDADLAAWRRRQRPLANLKPLIEILGLDHAGPSFVATSPATKPAAVPQPPPIAPPVPRLSPVPTRSPALPGRPALPVSLGSGSPRVGHAQDLKKSPVTLELRELTQHAAFLGGSGSGKTTLALNLIEQLAIMGVPAILVDRKGDLCGYAEESVWIARDEAPELAERRRGLRERLDVVVYTPGEPRGKSLAIPLTPADMATMSEQDRDTVAKVASDSLAGMMGYKSTGAGVRPLRALLYQAVAMLGQELAPRLRCGNSPTSSAIRTRLSSAPSAGLNRSTAENWLRTCRLSRSSIARYFPRTNRCSTSVGCSAWEAQRGRGGRG